MATEDQTPVGNLWYAFLTLNLWLCFTSVIMVVATAIALDVSVTAVGFGLFIPAFLCLFIYLEDRRRVGAEDEMNHPRRTQLVRRYHRGLRVLSAIGFIGYESLLAYFVITELEVGGLWFAIGQLPFFALIGYRQMKRFPGIDSAVVAGLWAFISPYAVIVATGHPFEPAVAVVFVAWFLIAFAGVESRNIRHLEGDLAAGNAPLAGYIGIRATRLTAIVLKSIGLAIFLIFGGIAVALIVATYLVILTTFRWLEYRHTGLPVREGTVGIDYNR